MKEDDALTPPRGAGLHGGFRQTRGCAGLSAIAAGAGRFRDDSLHPGHGTRAPRGKIPAPGPLL
jgi:hypothetical protein